jgi:hypothetical protein
MLHEVMGWPGPMTHRQALTWEAWLDEEMDRPSRADFYVMQLSCMVDQMFMDDPSLTNPNRYRMTFGNLDVKAAAAATERVERQETEAEILERINRSKAVWGAALKIHIPPTTSLKGITNTGLDSS